MHDQKRAPNVTSRPVARIAAQHPEAVVSIREFLLQNGCVVTGDDGASDAASYIISAGDSWYVKSFFERAPNASAKCLGIIYDGPVEERDFSHIPHVKIYVMDAVAITGDRAREIFEFLFTSSSRFKHTRKQQVRSTFTNRQKIIPEREPVSQRDAEHTSDLRRISDTMKEVYASARTHQKTHRQAHLSGLIPGALLLIAFAFIPLLTFITLWGAGTIFLYAAYASLTHGAGPRTTFLLDQSETNIRAALSISSMMVKAETFSKSGTVFQTIDTLIGVEKEFIRSGRSALNIARKGTMVTDAILRQDGSHETVALSDVVALSSEVSRLSQSLGLAYSRVQPLVFSGAFPFSISSVSREASDMLTTLSSVRSSVEYAERFLSLYPRIAGIRKKQTYLILLQNSFELRPTGGFIGSLLLVTFENGALTSMDVQDVYTADGQLKGHVEPPGPIREILGQEHWYLRDSNWNPEFSETARQAAWFYEKELGIETDGVIAISLPVLMRLLDVTGPVDLPDVNDRITASNFYAKSLLYTQTDFFPGSTQKKDFLGMLMRTVLEKITNADATSALRLVNAFAESVQSRDIQFYFVDPESQALVRAWDWSGAIDLDACRKASVQTPCVSDGISVISSNLGVNKVNFFIRQHASSTITLGRDGTIEHTLSFIVENTSPRQPDGSNVYRAYTRFLVPRQTEVTRIAINGIPVPARRASSALASAIPYYYYEDAGSMGVIHIAYDVNPLGQAEIDLSLFRSLEIPWADPSLYAFTFRKQAGVDSIPWTSVISYPPDRSAAGGGLVAKDGALQYNTDLTQDSSYFLLLD